MAPVTVAQMNLFLDLTLGAGLALAAGLRPFLPVLLAGGLSSADLGLDFDHAGYSFLDSGTFLLAVVVAFGLTALLERRLGPERLESGPLGAALSGIALGLAALLFAAVLSQHSDVGWAGVFAGLAGGALAQHVARGLLRRTRARLPDRAARQALPLYLDAVALALAGLSVLAPPLSLVALALLIRLLIAARQRGDERYAGLRILR